ncbi:MAG: aspartate 1-decarboxylase [Lachnospiraceae bacterium]
MEITMLKGKIHRAVVTQAEPDYVGSITIDSELMKAAGILEYQYVQVADVENGNRLETYTIEGEPGSGMICLNGAAARLVTPGDHVIIMAYSSMTPEEAATHQPTVVFVTEDNQLSTVTHYEKHGQLGVPGSC